MGWNNIDYTRFMADLNGDGKRDYVAFGQDAVYVNFGGSENGLPIVDFSRGTILADFAASQGFSGNTARGIEHVADFDQSTLGYQGAIIWAQTADGISYYRPTTADANTVIYETSVRELNAFGSDNGWTSSQTFDFAVVAQGIDASSSIVGFGQTGITLLARPFEDGSAMTPYFVSGSEAFGTDAGWDASRDVLAVRDAHGREIDLNGDGVLDVVGWGRSACPTL